jgi:tetratricopeptide (TPR) repeat protein
LRLLWNKLRVVLWRYEVPDNHFIEWDARYVPLLVFPLPGFECFGLLGVAGALAFAFGAWRRFGAAGELWVFTMLYGATIVLTVVSDRVRLALVPMLVAFAGYFVVEVAASVRAPRKLIALVPALALAAVAVFTPAMPERLTEKEFDERDFILGVRLAAEADYDAARPLFERLDAARPGSARIQLALAELEFADARAQIGATPPAGRMPSEGAALLESALLRTEKVQRRGTPTERFPAHVLEGRMRQYLGQWSAAERAFRAALEFDPQVREERRRLALVIAEQALLAPSKTLRDARLDEALALLGKLIAEMPEPEIEALRAQFRAQR